MIKILINDYLKDKSDTRLKILVSNVNPDFMLKKNKDMVVLVLEDYEKDPSPKRLKAIKNLLGGNMEKVSIKKAKKQMANNPNTIDDEYIGIMNEMKELNNQIVDAKGDKMVLGALMPIYTELNSRLDLAIRKREKEAMKNLDPVKIEKEMIIKLFGDPEDTNTHAYKILNGHAADFRIQMPYDPTVMIKKLFAHNSKEPYEYTAGLVDAVNRIWRVTKGQALASYDQGTRAI